MPPLTNLQDVNKYSDWILSPSWLSDANKTSSFLWKNIILFICCGQRSEFFLKNFCKIYLKLNFFKNLEQRFVYFKSDRLIMSCCPFPISFAVVKMILDPFSSWISSIIFPGSMIDATFEQMSTSSMNSWSYACNSAGEVSADDGIFILHIVHSKTDVLLSNGSCCTTFSEWVFICTRKLLLPANFLWHISHSCVLMPLCERMWPVKCPKMQSIKIIWI